MTYQPLKTRDLTTGEAMLEVERGKGEIEALSEYECDAISYREGVLRFPLHSIRHDRRWRLRNSQTHTPIPEPTEISGPEAFALVMREPEKWEAQHRSLPDADCWRPRVEWGGWMGDLLANHTMFRRRKVDPFEGVELPEGYSVKMNDQTTALLMSNGCIVAHPIDASMLDDFRAAVMVCERLAELEKKS